MSARRDDRGRTATTGDVATGRRRIAVGLILLVLAPGSVVPSSGQQAERRVFTVGPALKHDLDAHQLDSAQIESVANGVVEGLSTGNATPILDQSNDEVRVTAGATNKVVGKGELAGFVKRLLETPRLREDVLDNDEVVIKDDEVGLARGAVWIKQQCLDTACTKKKSAIVTINLP